MSTITISRVLLTGGPGFFSRLANVQLLAATRKLRGIEESRTRVPMEPGTMDVRDVHPNREPPIVATDLDHHAESFDAVAGSEFVDDRIRLRE